MTYPTKYRQVIKMPQFVAMVLVGQMVHIHPTTPAALDTAPAESPICRMAHRAPVWGFQKFPVFQKPGSFVSRSHYAPKRGFKFTDRL